MRGEEERVSANDDPARAYAVFSHALGRIYGNTT